MQITFNYPVQNEAEICHYLLRLEKPISVKLPNNESTQGIIVDVTPLNTEVILMTLEIADEYEYIFAS